VAERILIVEDDEGLREGLAFNLPAAGFEVEAAATTAAALERLGRGGIDAVILDVMLPDGSGFGVLARLRAAGDRVPVLLLTSRSLETDKVRGLELGADDYLTKPFGLAELIARVRALLRRARPGEGRTAPAAAVPAAVALGAVTVDLARCEARRGAERLPLSRYEVELLRLLFAHPGRVFSRSELLNLVWGYDRFPTTRTVDNHMARLRKKVEAAPDEPRFLVTVHGIGYRYDPPG
jgi:DNA-binding response OmpR family regulator